MERRGWMHSMVVRCSRQGMRRVGQRAIEMGQVMWVMRWPMNRRWVMRWAMNRKGMMWGSMDRERMVWGSMDRERMMWGSMRRKGSMRTM